MINITVIDADAIAYICSKEELSESLQNVDSLVNSILKNTNADFYYVILSTPPYFRKTINPDYKSKRRESELKYLREIRTYLVKNYNAIEIEKLEADDIVGYIKYTIDNSEEDYKVTIATTDKDVLKQLEGVHYDYKKSLFVETSAEDADYFMALQTLTGDSTDGITGIPGVGETKAKKILEEKDKDDSYIQAVFKYYTTKYPTAEAVYLFQKNFRQVYLLRVPQDYLLEVGVVPNIPLPNTLE